MNYSVFMPSCVGTTDWYQCQNYYFKCLLIEDKENKRLRRYKVMMGFICTLA